MDLWLGFVTNASIREQRMRHAARGMGIQTIRTSVTVLNSGIFHRPNDVADSDTENEEEEGNMCKIIQNLPRLTHYIEEPNLGKGFIKECCFSPDGRIMCSPCDRGIRLFSFNNSCNELSTCVPDQPQPLNLLVHFKEYHPEIVVSCKFSPFHNLLVSGCLGGQIVWYMPKF